MKTVINKSMLPVFLMAAPFTGMLLDTAVAANFRMGNFDRQGSRSIPSFLEPGLTKQTVTNKLEVKWFKPLTDSLHPDGLPAVAPPLVYKGIVYANSLSVDLTTFAFTGSISALNAVTGARIWQQDLDNSGAVGSAISRGRLYVISSSATLYEIDRSNGAILKSFKPNISPLDSAFGGPIVVPQGKKNLILMTINPNDENVSPGGIFGKSGVIAVNADTFTEVWRNVITVGNEGGSGVWNTTPVYSALYNTIYVSTGQTTNPDAINPQTSNAVFAIRASDGATAWKKQVTLGGDIFNFVVSSFDPTSPTDTDLGDSPELFFQGDKQYVGVGSKRGIYYVFDAKTGAIKNGSGNDGRFLRGLDLFYYNGTYGSGLPQDVVGNGLDGGFNLDGGFYRDSKGQLIHFGTFTDYTTSMRSVANNDPPWTNGTCDFSLTPCPDGADGVLTLISGDGTHELGRFVLPEAGLYAPLYLNGLIWVVASPSPPAGEPLGANRLLALDVSNPQNITVVADVELTKDGTTARSFGALPSISNCMIFVGSGLAIDVPAGTQQGLYAVGLKGSNGCNSPQDDD